MKMIKTYSHLITLSSFRDRFEYLAIGGKVGAITFGSRRYLNQVLYTSDEWRKTRNDVIVRDNGCDLGLDGYDITERIYIHHLNPITIEDIEKRRSIIFDLDNLVCVSRKTHEAIHYGDPKLLAIPIFSERSPGDTRLW